MFKHQTCIDSLVTQKKKRIDRRTNARPHAPRLPRRAECRAPGEPN